MIRRFAVVAATGLLLVAGQASAAGTAASLNGVKGQVLVSQGAAFTQASGAALKAGDRVVAMADGSASLKYADGCVIKLAPQAMATVGAQSPCAASQGLVRGSSPAQLDFASWQLLTLAALGAVVVAVASASDADPVVLPLPPISP